MHTRDNIFVGPEALNLNNTGGNPPSPYGLNAGDDPTQQVGVGPMATIRAFAITPLTKQAANVAALQASTQNVPLVLTAGVGATLAAAPDGSGKSVILFDTPRCVSLTSGANLSAINYTVVGYDFMGRLQTQTLAGPNITTVNTLKAFLAVLSVTPSATNAGTISVGTADIFGLPVRAVDASYIVSVKGNNVLAQDGGTFVAADVTSPATAATGDPRGTYAPSFASNGARKLTIAQFLDPTQIGPTFSASTLTNVLGVTPV